MINLLENVKKKFNARSIKHLIIIFIVFSISGSLTIYLSFPIINFFQIYKYIDNLFLLLIIRLLIIFPLYQLILISVGIIFGELDYFINFEKKFLKKLFLKKN